MGLLRSGMFRLKAIRREVIRQGNEKTMDNMLGIDGGASTRHSCGLSVG